MFVPAPNNSAGIPGKQRHYLLFLTCSSVLRVSIWRSSRWISRTSAFTLAGAGGRSGLAGKWCFISSYSSFSCCTSPSYSSISSSLSGAMSDDDESDDLVRFLLCLADVCFSAAICIW